MGLIVLFLMFTYPVCVTIDPVLQEVLARRPNIAICIEKALFVLEENFRLLKRWDIKEREHVT
jgi:hypothetical protein